MTSPVFGLTFTRVDDNPQPVLGAMLDVVGIIGPCSTADVTTFPLNQPVLIYTNDTATLDKLYDQSDETDGFIADAIDGIIDQLSDYQVAAQVVYVRTAYGDSQDTTLQLQQTIANIMGNSVAKTGVHAFLLAPNKLGCTPRLICAPGYTGQLANSLGTLTSDTAGAGYTPNTSYQVTFTPGSGETNEANLKLPVAHAVADANGDIDDSEIVIDSLGAWFTVAPEATLPAPDGPDIEAVAATGEILFSVNPSIGATITLNGSVVDFLTSGSGDLHVNIGADLAATLDNLVTVLNDSTDLQVSLCTYTRSNLSLIIVHDTAGAAGNGFTLAATVTGASVSGPHLTGGADAVAPVQATLIATMELGANPVCAELGGVLSSLMGHAVVESSCSSYVGDVQWRNQLNHRRLIGLSGGCRIVDESGDVVIMPLAPRVIGAIIARDFATGYPFTSAANTAIQGIVGPGRTIDFSLTDGATEGQQLLAINLGILARGWVGVESAISSGGFIFVGTDNLGDEELWRFYSIMRGRDYIELSLMPAHRAYLGRNNITAQTVKSVITTDRDFLAMLKAKNQILGSSVQFQGALNTASQIRAGRIVVSFEAEEPPPLRRIDTQSARYRPAIDQLVSQLEQMLTMGA